MRYASACDGIGAVHVAWKPLGWTCAWTAETARFPAAVVEHHYGIPNLGDITEITDEQLDAHGPIELLVGGTPCQSFSVAGLREGLADPRGNLALGFLGLAARARPEWVVWENVPGVLSSDGGRDFGTFLGALGQLGYGFAYRVLDAQYFGVPQRRRRVFVVGHLGDWRRAAAVLFERSCLSRPPAPRRESGKGVAALTAAGVGTCGADDNQAQAGHVVAARQTGRGYWNDDGLAGLRAHPGGAVVFDETQITSGENRCNPQSGDPSRPLASSARPPTLALPSVRRLTPRECERLQGFPDDYTLIPYRGKPAADGSRYKAIGNSMAVPVMRWIGERIAAVNEIPYGS